MNEENVKKKESKTKRKLVLPIIIMFLILLIGSSLIYYFLVYTKNNKPNQTSINNKSNQEPIIHLINGNYITYYEIKDSLNKYNKFINLKKSMGKKPGEKTKFNAYYFATSNDPENKDYVYVYIDSNGNFVFETNENKYYAKGITDKIVEYIYISGGEENSGEALLLSEKGELYYWIDKDYEYPRKNYEFKFMKVDTNNERVNGIIETNGTIYPRACGWSPTIFYAITNNGIKRIGYDENSSYSLKENINETFKISYYYFNNIFIDNKGYVLIIKDYESYNCEFSLPEKINENYYLLDDNNKKVRVDYSFEMNDSDGILYLVTNKNQIIKFNQDYDVNKKPFNLHTKKKVKSINASNKNENGYGTIKITYTDNSIEIFKTSTE